MDYQAVYDKIWATLDRITEREDRITEREDRITERQDRMEENYAKGQADLQAERALTQQKFRELANRMEETHTKWQAEHALTQQKFRELAESSARLDAQIDRVDKQIGELGNRLGEYVESMVAPACETLFAERGIPVHEVSPNRLARRFGDSMELDLTVINDHLLVVVEAKSKLSEKHVKKLLKKLPRVPIFFPTYAGMQIMGAVASMVVPDQVARMAMKAGLFVIAPSGDSVRLLNPMDFKPHLWNRVNK